MCVSEANHFDCSGSIKLLHINFKHFRMDTLLHQRKSCYLMQPQELRQSWLWLKTISSMWWEGQLHRTKTKWSMKWCVQK